MLSHVTALAHNTFRETVRDRIFYLVALFGLILLGSSAILSPLTIGAQGKIVADVNATKIFIEGTVKGDLHATVGVTVRDSGNVEGNIVSPKGAIEEGATFNGSTAMRSPGLTFCSSSR